MQFKFQLTDRALSAMLRGRFQRQDLCVPDALSAGANPMYVDHLEFTAVMPLVPHILSAGTPKLVSIPGGTQNLSVPTLVLTREVNVYTTTLDDLRTAGAAAPATTLNPMVLQFSLSVDHVPIVINNAPAFTDQLTLAYYGLDPLTVDGLANLGLSAKQVDARLRALLPPVSSPLPIASAFTSLGASTFKPESIWAGIAASNDFSIAEIRVEFSNTGASSVADPSSWENFYDNNAVESLVGTQDWAYFIEQDLLIGIVSSLVTPAVQTSASFRLESGPTFAWDGTLPGVVASFGGDVINACQCAWGDIDVSESITLDIDFSANDGWLQIDLHLDHSSNQLDLLCCELTAAALWPIVEFDLTEGTPDDHWLYIGGLVFPIFIFVGAILLETYQKPSVPAVKGFVSDPNDPSHLTSQVSVVTSLESADSTFEMTFVTGTSTGLVLGGTQKDNALKPAVIEVAVTPFAWNGPEVNCSGTSGRWLAQASVEVTRASGDMDFFYCAVSAIPPSWDGVLTTKFAYNPFSFTATISTPTYIAGEVSLLIQTTGGLRYITFAAMSQLSEQQISGTTVEQEIWRAEHCFTQLSPWSRYFSRFNPKWAIDPVIGESGEKKREQLWITAIAGFSPGDQLVVTTPSGQVVETAFANSAGAVRSNATINEASISMERRPSASEEPSISNSATLTQKQTLLAVVSSIVLQERALALQGVPTRYGSNILIATRSGVGLFKIGAQGSWSLLNDWAPVQLVGAFRAGGTLFGWTPTGELVNLSAVALRSPAPASAIASKLNAFGVREVSHAAIVDRKLFTVEAGQLLRSGESSGLPAVKEDITHLQAVGRSSLLLRMANGTFHLYTQANEVFTLSSVYEKRPWFDGSINIRGWTVALGEDRSEARLLSVVAQQTL